jgi:deoxynucleoside triphosphate triphosphohydrolase SAMHD1
LSERKIIQFAEELSNISSRLNLTIAKAFDEIGFTQDYVNKQISNRGALSQKRKVIKDSLWGLVELDSKSLHLLDCPLMQRLRGIKQLGLSYLTYPTAEHTRFSHSLGMYCVVSRFLEVMSRLKGIDSEQMPELGTYTPWVIDDKHDDSYFDDLRHAALLHDVGHMPFSHVSEKAVSHHAKNFLCSNISVSNFRSAASRCLEKNISLSELITLMVILHPRFIEYYNGFVRRNGSGKAIYRIASLIAGLPPEPKLRGLAELISDMAVDADKIDYLNRDAAACGIPIGIDVSRLFYRSTFLEIDKLESKKLKLGNDKTIIFAVNATGMDSIEEVVKARSTLYHRVYHHQTTRNAERVLSKCFELLSNGAHPDLHDIFKIWVLDDFHLLRIISKSRDTNLKSLSARILNRDLPKRTFVFGKNYTRTMMPIEHLFRNPPEEIVKLKDNLLNTVTGEMLELYTQSRGQDVEVSKIEDKIFGESKSIVKKLNEKNSAKIKRALPAIVSVLPMAFEKVNKDCTILQNGQLSLSSVDSTADEQENAAEIFKAKGYVLSDQQCMDIVFHAARKILSTENRLLYPIDQSSREDMIYGYQQGFFFDSAAIRRTIGLNVNDGITDTLVNKGYYDDFPQLIAVDELSEKILEKIKQLSAFDGQGTWYVSEESCKFFISQFPPKFRNEIERLIEQIKILDRKELKNTILTAIEKCNKPDQVKGFITALSPNSGNRVREIAEQELKEKLSSKNWIFCPDIEAALNKAKDDDYLTFCDDNSISGCQAESQFLTWLGIPREEWPIDCQSEENIFDHSLEDRIDKLKSVHTSICVSVGSGAARSRILKLKHRGLNKFIGFFYGHELEKITPVISKELEKFMRAVGIRLLAFAKYDHTGALNKLSPEKYSKCRIDSLGYGGKKGLMVTSINVPVSTITSFWCPGIYNGKPWMPLFLRRGYLKKFIVA